MQIGVLEVDTVWLLSVLKRMKYKAGWHFALDISNGPRLYLYAWVETDNDSRTYKERNEYETSKRWPIDWPPEGLPVDEETVIAWVRRAIQEWEIHESNEWLRFDTEIVHDPHVCKQCLIGGCRA